MERFPVYSLTVIAILLYSSNVLAQFYQINPSFQPVLFKRNEGNISSFIKQPDGKILVFGRMDYVNAVEMKSLVRLNGDGSLDDSFQFSSRTGPSSVALRRDGKIVSLLIYVTAQTVEHT